MTLDRNNQYGRDGLSETATQTVDMALDALFRTLNEAGANIRDGETFERVADHVYNMVYDSAPPMFWHKRKPRTSCKGVELK